MHERFNKLGPKEVSEIDKRVQQLEPLQRQAVMKQVLGYINHQMSPEAIEIKNSRLVAMEQSHSVRTPEDELWAYVLGYDLW